MDNDYFAEVATAVEEPQENAVEEIFVEEVTEPLTQITDISESDILNLPPETLSLSPEVEIAAPEYVKETPARPSSSVSAQQPSFSGSSTVKDGKEEIPIPEPIILEPAAETESPNVPQIGKSLKKAKKNNTPSNITPSVKTYRGNIGMFDMELTIEFSGVNSKCKEHGMLISGKYFYLSKPLNKKWVGGYTCGSTIVLNETDAVGAIKATFTGTIDANGSIKGKYQTDNGQKIDFNLK